MDPTKQKILEAAGQEFADRGFEGTTIRAICDRAGVNLAAVNYHFGGKEALYERVLMEVHRFSGPELDLPNPSVAPEIQLDHFLRHFLTDLVALEGQSRWEHVLMLRELSQPTPASDTLVRDVIGPRFRYLRAILQQLHPDGDALQITATAFSVVGQCLFYKLVGHMAERLVGAEVMKELDAEYLTRHIAQVTLSALADQKREKRKDPTERVSDGKSRGEDQ